MERIIMHIDVNNAFLSWSAIDLLQKGEKVDIRDIYAVVGGREDQRKGIVLSKSNLCKKIGIKTADTLYSARKKCKNLRVVPPNYKFYSMMSNMMFDFLRTFTPDIEEASIDECYLDYGKVKMLYGDQYQFALMIQKEIFNKFGFTVNIGIANNKLCAKMASDFSKPNKIHTLYDEEVPIKMYPLPIGDLFGIGAKTKEKLNELGIKTIKDLAFYDLKTLKKYFKNMAIVMQNSARGINNDPVISDNIVKGISNEITLSADTSNRDVILKSIYKVCQMVVTRLKKDKRYAYTVAVIIKDNNFKRVSHQKKLKNPSNNFNEIYDVSKEIFEEMDINRKVRLVGVRLDNLVEDRYVQTSLFSDDNVILEDEKIDDVIDDINTKFGYKVIDKGNKF